jgi:hypothetical protein
MSRSSLRPVFAFFLGFSAILSARPLAAQSAEPTTRQIVVDIKDSAGPVDRFFDLSVGSDYPGTLIRDDSHAQLKLTVDELGFRYIRFHAIFHDVMERPSTTGQRSTSFMTTCWHGTSGRLSSSVSRRRRLPPRRTAFSTGTATHRTRNRKPGTI